MPFPIFRRPGAVTFLDDDPEYLQMLAMTFPSDWQVSFFTRPKACVDALLKEVSVWNDDAWNQQAVIRRWGAGNDLLPDVLKYWRTAGPSRYALTRVAVFDYAMPEMSGLQAIEELSPWQGWRLLLTGRVDEQLGVSAFNRGLIEQFVRKQSVNHRVELSNAVQSLLFKAHPRHEHLWRVTMSRAQLDLLNEQHVSIGLADIARQHGLVEHIVIGVPFGILGLDRFGRATWLKLVRAGELRHLAEIARYDGMSSEKVAAVAAGELIVERDLHASLGLGFTPTLAVPSVIGFSDQAVYVGAYSIPVEYAPGESNSYQHHVASIGPRILQAES